MVNWYYVIGSERVGPVSVAALQVLFANNEITLDTYVWKKGFANWERLKDVTELNLSADIPMAEAEEEIEEITFTQMKVEPAVEEKIELKAPVKKEVAKENTREIKLDGFMTEEKASPEVNFSFSWHTLNEDAELFFIKIGKDRKNSSDDIYGPYSLVELRAALSDKRINLNTLIFAPGMSSWTKIQDTPANENYTGMALSGVSLTEVPLVMVFDSSPLPLVTMVKKAGVKDGILLGAGPFLNFQNKTVRASLYVGSEIKVKNVQVIVQNYDKQSQAIECMFVDLNTDARKIMLNHAV